MSAIKSEMRELSSVERELSIVIPSATVAKEIDKAYQRLGQKVNLKGFRQGKVPRSVLERYYKADVERDVLERTLGMGYKEAVLTHKLQPVADPSVEAQSDFILGTDFSFTAKVQIKPDIELKKWQKLQVTAPLYTAGDAEVEAELERIRDQQSTLVAVTDRSTIEQGDSVDCSIEATTSGHPVKELTAQQTIEIGSGKYFAEAEQALVGKSLNDNEAVHAQVTLPESYYVERLRNQVIDLAITPSAIKSRVKPALDDEFAKDVSDQFETLDALKKAISDSLETEKVRRNEDGKKDAVIDALIKENDFEVPMGMVAKQAEYMAANMLNQFPREQAERIWKTLGEKLKEEAMPRAERTVRISMILEAIAKILGITVSEEEVEAEFDKEAARMNTTKAKLKARYKADDLAYMRDRLESERALDAAVDAANISTVEKPLRGEKDE